MYIYMYYTCTAMAFSRQGMNVTLYGMVTVPGVAGIAFAEGFL